MKKILLSLLICLGGISGATCQTLFTYGTYQASASDFVRAYSKNSNKPNLKDEKAVKDYLKLYILSKLKVQEAYDRKMDTLPGLVAEVSNLRSQIVENYMTDPELTERMVKEAFTRSQKDIHAAHIFISYTDKNGKADTTAAKAKRDYIIERLKKGNDFSGLAEAFSDDPAAKEDKGDIGYITLFTLPYPFENAIYNTAPGKSSAPVTSVSGFHIFKNVGERKALGKIKAQQILIAFPPAATAEQKEEKKKLADSLYERIQKGDDFSELARAFSNDYVSAAAGGTMPEIRVGEYDPDFEQKLWSLKKNGEVSNPFLTEYGWHIVKRISVIPVVQNPADKDNLKELETLVMTDSRWKASDDFIFTKVKKEAGVTFSPVEKTALWAYTDSLLDRRPMTSEGKKLMPATLLLTIGNKKYTIEDWLTYGRNFRFKPDGSAPKPLAQLWDEWLQYIMLNYYRDHLEDFNPAFRVQMNEFKEGNLFFEIMQEKVWNKAQADTMGLKNLFAAHPENYRWQQSADVIIFFCADKQIAGTVYEGVKKNPADWKQIIEEFSSYVIADSARYEWKQIPNLDKKVPVKGMLTAPLINETDNTASFAYILKTYPDPMPRSFQQAKGMLINDYQEMLEKEWNEKLLKKYPVVIKEKVLNSISK